MTGQNTQSPNQKKTSRSIAKITKIMMDTIDNNDNMLVPWYLMAAYAYYIDDDPILEDVMFDRLAKKLLKVWDTVEHQHKEFLTKDMLNGRNVSWRVSIKSGRCSIRYTKNLRDKFKP